MILERLTADDFDAAYAIMEASFPKAERKTYEEQKALLAESAYRMYGAKDEATGELLGFAAFRVFPEFLFFEHLAVNPNCRNGGIGKKLLDKVKELADGPVCLEVELPTTEIAARRIAYYERNGFYLNEYPYVQPSLAEGCEDVPMYIMTTGRKLTMQEHFFVRDILYQRVYHVEG